MGRIMIKNEYRPLNNKFRLFGYIVSLIGLFKITIPQNQWLLIPVLIQNFYTLRALKNGPHKDIFSEFKRDVSPLKDLLRILVKVWRAFENYFKGLDKFKHSFKHCQPFKHISTHFFQQSLK